MIRLEPLSGCRSFSQSPSQDSSFDTCFIAEQRTLIGPSLDVSSNTHISLDGNGYAGGANYNKGSGPSSGLSSSNSGGGGGHAGKGGNSNSSTTNGGTTIYGSTLSPSTPGSGGGGGAWAAGGNGGGVIRLDIKNITTINGSVSANGLNATDYTGYTGGGGAGGSIFITTDTLSGSGFLSSQGGRGGNITNYYDVGGGASGGRIAVYYNSNSSSLK